MRERDLATMDIGFKPQAELVGIDPDEDDDERDDFGVDDGAWREELVAPLRKIEYRDDPKAYASPLRLAVVGDSAAWTI